jgi:hypothetical protein
MTPTFIQHPTHYTLAEFRTMLAGAQLGAWRPRFPTLHNTGVPSLKQWLAYGPTPQERWGASLNRYYEGMGGTPDPTSLSVRTMFGFSAISQDPASPSPAGIPRRSESR